MLSDTEAIHRYLRRGRRTIADLRREGVEMTTLRRLMLDGEVYIDTSRHVLADQEHCPVYTDAVAAAVDAARAEPSVASHSSWAAWSGVPRSWPIS